MVNKKRRIMSMRGEVVDFDLMDIKNQMANQPKPTEVKRRETFIESRLRRRAKKLEEKTKTLATQLNKDKTQNEEKKQRDSAISHQDLRETDEVAKNKPKIRHIKKKKVN